MLLDRNKMFVTIHHTGMVEVPNPYLVTYKCPMDVKAFPYDDQSCIIAITVWSFDDSSVRLQTASTLPPGNLLTNGAIHNGLGSVWTLR